MPFKKKTVVSKPAVKPQPKDAPAPAPPKPAKMSFSDWVKTQLADGETVVAESDRGVLTSKGRKIRKADQA